MRQRFCFVSPTVAYIKGKSLPFIAKSTTQDEGPMSPSLHRTRVSQRAAGTAAQGADESSSSVADLRSFECCFFRQNKLQTRFSRAGCALPAALLLLTLAALVWIILGGFWLSAEFIYSFNLTAEMFDNPIGLFYFPSSRGNSHLESSGEVIFVFFSTWSSSPFPSPPSHPNSSTTESQSKSDVVKRREGRGSDRQAGAGGRAGAQQVAVLPHRPACWGTGHRVTEELERAIASSLISRLSVSMVAAIGTVPVHTYWKKYPKGCSPFRFLTSGLHIEISPNSVLKIGDNFTILIDFFNSKSKVTINIWCCTCLGDWHKSGLPTLEGLEA